jgi:hypothetical protein
MAKNKKPASSPSQEISGWVKSELAKNKKSRQTASSDGDDDSINIDPRILWGLLGAVGAVLAIGTIGYLSWSRPSMQSVQGVVKLDGKPISNCKVGFFPELKETEIFNPDRHGFGFGLTDNSGKFTIQHPQGEEGIWAGQYKVTFVAWVTAKGDPLPPETKPSEVEGGVLNLFPDYYEAPSTTRESVKVEKGVANVFNFDIKTK